MQKQSQKIQDIKRQDEKLKAMKEKIKEEKRREIVSDLCPTVCGADLKLSKIAKFMDQNSKKTKDSIITMIVKEENDQLKLQQQLQSLENEVKKRD